MCSWVILIVRRSKSSDEAGSGFGSVVPFSRRTPGIERPSISFVRIVGSSASLIREVVAGVLFPKDSKRLIKRWGPLSKTRATNLSVRPLRHLSLATASMDVSSSCSRARPKVALPDTMVGAGQKTFTIRISETSPPVPACIRPAVGNRKTEAGQILEISPWGPRLPLPFPRS
jgi:hypothetical protein